jgi:hypothetical protein
VHAEQVAFVGAGTPFTVMGITSAGSAIVVGLSPVGRGLF